MRYNSFYPLAAVRETHYSAVVPVVRIKMQNKI